MTACGPADWRWRERAVADEQRCTGGGLRHLREHSHLKHKRPLDDAATDAEKARAEPGERASERVQNARTAVPLHVVGQKGVTASLAPCLPAEEDGARCGGERDEGDQLQRNRSPVRRGAAMYSEGRLVVIGPAEVGDEECGSHGGEERQGVPDG